jgi:hypothetical protein
MASESSGDVVPFDEGLARRLLAVQARQMPAAPAGAGAAPCPMTPPVAPRPPWG